MCDTNQGAASDRGLVKCPSAVEEEPIDAQLAQKTRSAIGGKTLRRMSREFFDTRGSVVQKIN